MFKIWSNSSDTRREKYVVFSMRQLAGLKVKKVRRSNLVARLREENQSLNDERRRRDVQLRNMAALHEKELEEKQSDARSAKSEVDALRIRLSNLEKARERDQSAMNSLREENNRLKAPRSTELTSGMPSAARLVENENPKLGVHIISVPRVG